MACKADAEVAFSGSVFYICDAAARKVQLVTVESLTGL